MPESHFQLLLRQVQRIFIISWSYLLQYRADVVMWSLFSIITPLLSLVIWQAALAAANPERLVELRTYYLLAILVELMTRSWRGYYLVEQILNGSVIKYLLRPRILLLEFVANNLCTKAMQLLIPLPLFILALIFSPQWFSPAIYQSSHLLLFTGSVILAAGLGFAFNISLGLLAFWIEEASELHSYSFLLRELTSGLLIPLYLMPEWARSLANALPFRYIISAPLEIILGQVDLAGALQLLLYQALWLIAFVFIMRTLWLRGLKTYAVPSQ
jgi:ABC-2 type transport system permease protein